MTECCVKGITEDVSYITECGERMDEEGNSYEQFVRKRE